MLGRGLLPMIFAAALVTMLLLVTFDLDRPTRGLITVPLDAARVGACIDGAPTGCAAVTLFGAEIRPRYVMPIQPRSKRACSSAVRSAVGTASSRSSGMSSPLSMERP
jgi:hypothetical protein